MLLAKSPFKGLDELGNPQDMGTIAGRGTREAVSGIPEGRKPSGMVWADSFVWEERGHFKTDDQNVYVCRQTQIGMEWLPFLILSTTF